LLAAPELSAGIPARKIPGKNDESPPFKKGGLSSF
jgi:hypothetical protein